MKPGIAGVAGDRGEIYDMIVYDVICKQRCKQHYLTCVQEIWNQMLQELQAMEGIEQPTCLEQTPHGLFLGHNVDTFMDQVHYLSCFEITFLLQSIICNCA